MLWPFQRALHLLCGDGPASGSACSTAHLPIAHATLAASHPPADVTGAASAALAICNASYYTTVLAFNAPCLPCAFFAHAKFITTAFFAAAITAVCVDMHEQLYG